MPRLAALNVTHVGTIAGRSTQHCWALSTRSGLCGFIIKEMCGFSSIAFKAGNEFLKLFAQCILNGCYDDFAPTNVDLGTINPVNFNNGLRSSY